MRTSSISLREAAEMAATGDIWLFRGGKPNDRVVHAATNSPINHVAMAVALDDLPPLLWHTEDKASTVDVWTGKEQSGVQLQRLEDAVEVWGGKWKHRVYFRQLEPPVSRSAEHALLRMINEYSGRGFPSGRRLTHRYLSGRARRRLPPNEVFCAELIATTYQRLGYLASKKPPNWYDPGRFWSGDHTPLIGGATLGGEIEVHVR